MIYLSEVLIQNPQLDSFEDLMDVIREVVKQTTWIRLPIGKIVLKVHSRAFILFLTRKKL
jgi:hypothetical protein